MYVNLLYAVITWKHNFINYLQGSWCFADGRTHHECSLISPAIMCLHPHGNQTKLIICWVLCQTKSCKRNAYQFTLQSPCIYLTSPNHRKTGAGWAVKQKLKRCFNSWVTRQECRSSCHLYLRDQMEILSSIAMHRQIGFVSGEWQKSRSSHPATSSLSGGVPSTASPGYSQGYIPMWGKWSHPTEASSGSPPLSLSSVRAVLSSQQA